MINNQYNLLNFKKKLSNEGFLFVESTPLMETFTNGLVRVNIGRLYGNITSISVDGVKMHLDYDIERFTESIIFEPYLSNGLKEMVLVDNLGQKLTCEYTWLSPDTLKSYKDSSGNFWDNTMDLSLLFQHPNDCVEALVYRAKAGIHQHCEVLSHFGYNYRVTLLNIDSKIMKKIRGAVYYDIND